MPDTHEGPQTGFALVEAVLILIIVGLIAGVGYWVVTQRNSTNVPATPTANAGQAAVPAGTAAAIDQLSSQDAQGEASIYSQQDSSDQSTAQSTNAALNSLGGAYNETTF